MKIADHIKYSLDACDSRELDKAMLRQAEQAGAKIVKPAQPTFYGGYAGYFQDPDGHLWESLSIRASRR